MDYEQFYLYFIKKDIYKAYFILFIEINKKKQENCF